MQGSVTDDLHHTVRKFTPEGKLLLTIGDPDKPAELQGGKPFNRPTHVAICPRSGYLFVSDGYGNSRVHKYAPDGTYVMSDEDGRRLSSVTKVLDDHPDAGITLLRYRPADV